MVEPELRPDRKYRLRLAVTREGTPMIGEWPVFSGSTEDFWEEALQLSQLDVPQLVVTPNVDQVLQLERDPDYRRVFGQAALRVVDGAPILALLRLLGARGVQRLTGADLLPSSAALSAARGVKVVITGGLPETLKAARDALVERYPSASIAAIDFPMIADLGDDRSKGVVAMIAAQSPEIVFLCLGAPKQEKWFDTWSAVLPPAVYIGAGAAVDFAAGRAKRAPSALQKVGLEWVWRLASDPKRLAHRYLGRGPRFLGVILRSSLGRGR